MGLKTVGKKEALAKRTKYYRFFIMSLPEIDKMSFSDRLQTMERLWDSLCRDESILESPSWHGDVLRERKKWMDSPEAKFITVEELRKRYH